MSKEEELFPCTCCGQCCRRIDKAVENFKTLSSKYPELNLDTDFPYSWSESGVCSMLDDNNRCKCYDSRPQVCNSSLIFDKMSSLGLIDRETFKNISIISCKWLQGYPVKCSEKTWKRRKING